MAWFVCGMVNSRTLEGPDDGFSTRSRTGPTRSTRNASRNPTPASSKTDGKKYHRYGTRYRSSLFSCRIRLSVPRMLNSVSSARLYFTALVLTGLRTRPRPTESSRTVAVNDFKTIPGFLESFGDV